jgi:hypothetical protein
VAEPDGPVMIVVGGGAIALGTTQEHRILSLFSLFLSQIISIVIA